MESNKNHGRAHNAGLCPSLGIDTTEKECIMVYGIKIQWWYSMDIQYKIQIWE